MSSRGWGKVEEINEGCAHLKAIPDNCSHMAWWESWLSSPSCKAEDIKNQLPTSFLPVIKEKCAKLAIFKALLPYSRVREGVGVISNVSCIGRCSSFVMVFNPFTTKTHLQILLCLTPDDLLVKGRPLGSERVKPLRFERGPFCSEIKNAVCTLW